jgi:hypothetical protein
MVSWSAPAQGGHSGWGMDVACSMNAPWIVTSSNQVQRNNLMWQTYPQSKQKNSASRVVRCRVRVSEAALCCVIQAGACVAYFTPPSWCTGCSYVALGCSLLPTGACFIAACQMTVGSNGMMHPQGRVYYLC